MKQYYSCEKGNFILEQQIHMFFLCKLLWITWRGFQHWFRCIFMFKIRFFFVMSWENRDIICFKQPFFSYNFSYKWTSHWDYRNGKHCDPLQAGVHKNINCLQDFFSSDKLSKKVRDIKFWKFNRLVRFEYCIVKIRFIGPQ